MLHDLYQYIYQIFNAVNYPAIFVMMLIESTALPFPSELPMLAVGIQSARGTMNPFIGLAISLFAISIGATINYYIGYYLGDAFMVKYGKYFFIKPHAYQEAKKLFEQDENFYTFYGRLIPLVRQLMSFPAGMVRMPYWRFLGLTLAGSALWLSILIALGYFIGDNIELVKPYLYVITVVILAAGGLWFLRHHHFSKRTIAQAKIWLQKLRRK